jgi:anti-sigma B factor antagonist
MQLGLDVHRSGAVAVISARGDLDLASAPRLRAVALDELLAGCRRLVLDLRELEFVDSVGLGMIVAVLKRARGLGGDLALVVGTERIRRPLELTGIARVVEVFDDLDTARQVPST